MKRELWIDIAKGIGIILVVIGHSSKNLSSHYIYWFHMPLFFILSGYTLKPKENMSEFFMWLRKRSYQFLIPYAAFGILIVIIVSCLDLISGNFNLIKPVKNVAKLIFGGQILDGPFGVFWFITSLFLAQILFVLLLIKVKSNIKRATILMIAYVLSHIQALYFSDIPIPWNADVSFMVIVYLAIGYYLRPFFAKLIKLNNFIILTSLSLLFISLDSLGFIKYSLDMKYSLYNHFFLDLIIPVIFSLWICMMCYSLVRFKYLNNILAKIGIISLTIMYLHLPINAIIPNNNWIVFTFAGVVIPFLIHIILERFKITQYLFLGQIPKFNSRIVFGKSKEIRQRYGD